MRWALWLWLCIGCVACSTPPAARPAAGDWRIVDGAGRVLDPAPLISLTHQAADDLQATLHGRAYPELGAEQGMQALFELKRSDPDRVDTWISDEVPLPRLGVEQASRVLCVPTILHVEKVDGEVYVQLRDGLLAAEGQVWIELEPRADGRVVMRLGLEDGAVQTYSLRQGD